MRKAGGARIALLAASGLGHAVVLGLLTMTRPTLPVPAPAPVLQVQIVPAYLLAASPRPEPKAARRPASPPRAPRPRLARRPADETPMPPLILSAPPAGPAPGVQAPNEGLRAALRGGPLGCANPETLRLDKRARDRCLQRLGADAAGAAFIPAPLAKAKQADFDRAAARKAADRRYREAPIPPGLSTSDAAGGITGLGETGHGAVPFP